MTRLQALRAHPPRTSGFSMIELMISVTIGLLLTAAVLQTFVSMKRTYEFNEEFSRIQQNGRFAMNYLTRDVRMAGHFGCFSRNFDLSEMENDLADSTNTAWDIAEPLDGHDNVSDSFSDYDDVVEGTDVIVLKFMNEKAYPLVSPFKNNNANGQFFVHENLNADCGGGSDCHEGEIFMVTDCTKGAIFQATNIQNTSGGDSVNVTHSNSGAYTPGNLDPKIDEAYGEGAFLARFESYAYYVAREDLNDEPALYRSRLTYSSNNASLTAEELVEGVEDMQILYGEDTSGNGSPNYFVPADEVVNMGDVVSVQINLSFRII